MRDINKEKQLLLDKDIYDLYYYARDVIKGRWPEAEPHIMTDPRWAYRYALDVIKGRWPEAESIIMTDSEWAAEYAKNIIKGRWLEAEPISIQDNYYWKWYNQMIS